MLYEEGFKALEGASFTAATIGKQMRELAAIASEAGTENLELTLGYDKRSQVGDLVPEIILRVREVEDPDEEEPEE